MAALPPPEPGSVVEGDGRRRLSTWVLVGWIAVFFLVPQIVAIFAVPGISEDPAYFDVRSALQLEIIPDAGGAIIAAVLIWRLGWVDLVRHERFRTHRWVVLVPATMLIASIAAIDYGNLADAGSEMVIVLAAGTFFTGVSEELMFRGVALQAMRDRHTEARAAVLSSTMFGLLHLFNVIVAGGGAVFQALWAIGIGYLLYLCRRVGHGMVLPVVVHWLWDFSTFSPEVGVDESPLLSDAQFAMFLISIVLVIVAAASHKHLPASPPAERR